MRCHVQQKISFWNYSGNDKRGVQGIQRCTSHERVRKNGDEFSDLPPVHDRDDGRTRSPIRYMSGLRSSGAVHICFGCMRARPGRYCRRCRSSVNHRTGCDSHQHNLFHRTCTGPRQTPCWQVFSELQDTHRHRSCCHQS